MSFRSSCNSHQSISGTCQGISIGNDTYEITRTYQYGDWRHVERAAPIPVPVQIRIPRLYSVDVFETPANWKNLMHEYDVFRDVDILEYLQLTSPDSFGRICNKTLREVTLDTCDHVVIFGMWALTVSDC